MTSRLPIPAWFIATRAAPSPWHEVRLSVEAVERIVASRAEVRATWNLLADLESALATEAACFDWQRASGFDLVTTFEGYASAVAGVATCLPPGFDNLPWLARWRCFQLGLLAAPAELVQRWLGHSTLSMMLDVYREFIPDHAADAADAAKLGELLK